MNARRLLAADSGLFGQGVRFAIAGSVVALVYLLTTTVLALVVGLPFQIALPVGFGVATAVHFTLQRKFVWAHGAAFALPLRRQAGRYLVVAGAQYGVTAVGTSVLPGLLGLPTEVVYLGIVALLVSANFVVFRNGVFHADPGERSRAGP